MSNLLQEIEQALDSPVPPGEARAAVEAIAEDSAVEEVAAAGLALTATEWFPIVIILGMLAAAATWLRPLFKAQAHGRQSLLGRFVNWAGGKLEQGIKYIEARVEHAMSHWLAPKALLLAHWLNSTTHIVHTLTQAVGDLSDATHEALVFLRHHVVPELIVAAARPMVRAIEAVTAKVNALEVRLQRAIDSAADVLAGVGVSVEHSMAGVLTGIAALVAPIYTEVYETLVPTVKELQTQVKRLTLYVFNEIAGRVTTLEDQMTDLLNRVIPAIQASLAPAALLAAVAGAMGPLYQTLTCENTQAAAKTLCNEDKNIVNSLLNGLLDVLVLADLCEIGRLAFLAAEGFEPVLADLVSATNHICLFGGATGPTAITQADAPGLF